MFIILVYFINKPARVLVPSTVGTLPGSGRTSIMQQIECVVLEAVKFIGILVKPEYGEQ